MNKQKGFAPSEVHAQGGRRNRPELSLRGFTLLEVLVVVAIIALLASISVPAANRAKIAVKATVCKSNLQQLGQIWNLYTVDHGGFFMKRGWDSRRGAVSWFHCIRKHYWPNKDLIVCPLAVKTQREGGTNPYMAWENTTKFGFYYRGSYGINLWVANGAVGDEGGPYFDGWCWRTPSAKGAAQAPLLLCSQWKDMQPYPEDVPLPYESRRWTAGPKHEMRRPCIKRHAPYYVNVLFLDFSVDKRTIKELWRLKWHKNWPPNDPLPIWPAWMADVPEP